MPRTKPGEITMKQRKFVSEFIKTANASHAALYAYNTTKKNAAAISQVLKNNPKVKNAIEVAFRKLNLDEDYAVESLKAVIDAGKQNSGDAKPADTLRGLEMFFRMKGYLGNDRHTIDNEDEQNAQKMTTEQLVKAVKELDKKQERILKLAGVKIEEAEVVSEEKHESAKNKHQ